jgi:hypothetical protein
MIVSFHKLTEAHNVAIGDTILHPLLRDEDAPTLRVQVDQVTAELLAGERTYLFRGHAAGYKRRVGIRAKAGEQLRTDLTLAEAIDYMARIKDDLRGDPVGCTWVDEHLYTDDPEPEEAPEP